MFIVFGRDISLVLQTREISLRKNNSHDLHRVITLSLVLVIWYIAMFVVRLCKVISSGRHGIRCMSLSGDHPFGESIEDSY